MDFDWDTVKSIYIYPDLILTSTARCFTVEQYLSHDDKYLPGFQSIIDNTEHLYSDHQKDELKKLIRFLDTIISDEDPLKTGLEFIKAKCAPQDISGNVSLISSSAPSEVSEEAQQLVNTPTREQIAEGYEVPEADLIVLREAIAKNNNKPPKQEDLARFETAAKSSPEPTSPVQPPPVPVVTTTQPHPPAPAAAAASSTSSSQVQQQQQQHHQTPPSKTMSASHRSSGSVIVVDPGLEMFDLKNGLDHKKLSEMFKSRVKVGGACIIRAKWHFNNKPEKVFDWRGIACYNEKGEPIVGWQAPDTMDKDWKDNIQEYAAVAGLEYEDCIEKDPTDPKGEKTRPKSTRTFVIFPAGVATYRHVIFDAEYITEQASSKSLASDPSVRAQGHLPSVAPSRHGPATVSFANGSPAPHRVETLQVANDRSVATSAQVGELSKAIVSLAEGVKHISSAQVNENNANNNNNNNNRRPFAAPSAMGGIFSGCSTLRDYADQVNNCFTHINNNQQRAVEINKALVELGKQSWGLTEASKGKEMVKHLLDVACTAILFAADFEECGDEEGGADEGAANAKFNFNKFERVFDKAMVMLQANVDGWQNPKFDYIGFKNQFEIDQNTPHATAAKNCTINSRRKGGFAGFKSRNKNNNNNRNRNNNNNNNNNRSSGGNNNSSSGNASAGAH